MSNKRKLWQIFGPVLCAFILLIILFLIPWQNGEKSDNALFKASVSQSQTVFKGQSIKQAAFEKTMFHSMGLVNYQEWMPCTQVS